MICIELSYTELFIFYLKRTSLCMIISFVDLSVNNAFAISLR